MKRSALLCGIVLMACGGEAEAPDVLQPAAVSAEFPALSRIRIADSIATMFDIRWHKVAVSREGSVALFRSEDDEPMIVVLDSSGSWRASFGRFGEGPGEFRGPTRLWWQGDTLVAFEPMRQVRILTTADGRLLDEHRSKITSVTVASGPGRFFEYDPEWRSKGEQPTLTRRDFPSDAIHLFLGGSTTPFGVAVGATSPAVFMQELWPVIAMKPGEVALLDPLRNHLWLLSPTGAVRDSFDLSGLASVLGPREFTEQRSEIEKLVRGGPPGSGGGDPGVPGAREALAGFDKRPRPLAYRHGMQYDSNGRLWILGSHLDSTRAIVLVDGKVIGTHMLGCYRPGRFVELTGSWLALLCSRGAEADPPFELQLYRIQPPDGNRPSSEK